MWSLFNLGSLFLFPKLLLVWFCIRFSFHQKQLYCNTKKTTEIIFHLKQKLLQASRSFPLSSVFLLTLVLTNIDSKVLLTNIDTCPFDSDGKI